MVKTSAALAADEDPLPSGDDIVTDILRRVIAMAPAFSAALARQVEQSVRRDWGGDRVFIARREGEGRSQRNDAIRRDYLAGERLALLERRYGLSQRQLLRVIKLPAGDTPCLADVSAGPTKSPQTRPQTRPHPPK